MRRAIGLGQTTPSKLISIVIPAHNEEAYLRATLDSLRRQDYPAFAETELKHRTEVGLPPITRMVRIIIRNQSLEKLQEQSEKLAGQVSAAVGRESGLSPRWFLPN